MRNCSTIIVIFIYESIYSEIYDLIMKIFCYKLFSILKGFECFASCWAHKFAFLISAQIAGTEKCIKFLGKVLKFTRQKFLNCKIATKQFFCNILKLHQKFLSFVQLNLVWETFPSIYTVQFSIAISKYTSMGEIINIWNI